MSVSKNKKQQGSGNGSKGQNAAVVVRSRNQGAKMLGTRVGTLNDWRGGSGKGGSERSQHGKRRRDGQ